MNRAMFAAASGMAAQQTQLEIVADNLANADVAGFKGAAATFADVRAGALGLGTTTVGKHALFDLTVQVGPVGDIREVRIVDRGAVVLGRHIHVV